MILALAQGMGVCCAFWLRRALLAVGLHLTPNAEAIRSILAVRVELVLEFILGFQDQASVRTGWAGKKLGGASHPLDVQHCCSRRFLGCAPKAQLFESFLSFPFL
jgi:hypothetical protein